MVEIHAYFGVGSVEAATVLTDWQNWVNPPATPPMTLRECLLLSVQFVRYRIAQINAYGL